MSVGTGRYANPRDGDVVEMDVDVTEGTVAVTRLDLRCCEAAARATRELARWAHGKTPEDAALKELA